MELLPVTGQRIAQTAAFASDVFIDYYTPLIGEKQARYMADLFLSEKAIAKLIDEGAVFETVVREGEIIGFCEYKKEGRRLFLSKLYVRKDHRHEGVGSFMWKKIRNYAESNNLDSIYLTVNKGNTPSYEIYKHLGFKVIDAVVNDIGQGYVMDDYIMEYAMK
ncbi:MAG: GNAT family N-acetyltransferase [Erysipelotrichaceae bacterium]|nr:GNAT family N-acetyltransferase [Erysipelotrichaceae bacterium]